MLIRTLSACALLVLAACQTTRHETESKTDPDPIENPPLTAKTEPDTAKTDPKVKTPGSDPVQPAAQKRYVGASVDAFGAT